MFLIIFKPRWATRQDPMFGINQHNVASRLTSRNYRDKAVVRIEDKVLLYIYITQDQYCRPEPDQRRIAYNVRVHAIHEEPARQYFHSFPYLRDALAYVNGDDDGDLAQYTKAVGPSWADINQNGTASVVMINRKA